MTNEKKSDDRLLSLRLFAVTLLAFAAALLFRRSAGLIAMTPISLLLCAVAAFIPMRIYVRCALFGITVFAVNSIESGRDVAIIFSALCILACALFGYAASKIKAKKGLGISLLCVFAILCTLLNVYFIGNPIKAYSAMADFDEYTERVYPENEHAVLGSFDISPIYYQWETKAYTLDIVSSKYPTEGASLTLGGKVINDGFKSRMEQNVAEQYVSALSAVLREALPNEEFEVSFDRFIAKPGQAILSAERGALAENVCYEIYIRGIQTGDDMKKYVKLYTDAIDRSGIGYARLTFKSGIGTWQQRYVSIDPNHPVYHPEIKLNYINTASSNYFFEYLLKLQEK